MSVTQLTPEQEYEANYNLNVIISLAEQLKVHLDCFADDLPLRGKPKNKINDCRKSMDSFTEYMRDFIIRENKKNPERAIKEMEQQAMIFGEFFRLVNKDPKTAELMLIAVKEKVGLDIS